MSITDRLKEKGIMLPTPPKAVASYVGFVKTGNFVFISGQLPMESGVLKYKGKVGLDIDLETAQAASKLCAINILAQLHAATEGRLETIKKIIRLGGFVNCTDSFTDQPKVINGSSDFIADIFGPDIGSHSRAAVGVNSLPLSACVEIEALVAVQ